MKAADQALSGIRQIAGKNLLHDELFTTHLARMALMLADHNYSAKRKQQKSGRHQTMKSMPTPPKKVVSQNKNLTST